MKAPHMTPTEDPGLVSLSPDDGLVSVARPDARDAKTQRDAELQALLTRVEAATGEDRELDADLAAALRPDDAAYVRYSSGWTRAGQVRHWVPAYTASLDAALALVERVLPGWSWGVSGATTPKCDALLYEPSPGGYRVKIKASAKTPALALCAALLKALASQQPRDQQVAGDRSRETPLLNTSEADEKR